MITYIYDIEKLNGEILYVGRTTNIINRWKKHMNDIKNNKHPYVTYQEYLTGIKYNILYKFNSDKNSYLIDLIENVVISSTDCRNDIVINKKHFSKLERNLSLQMLDNFIENNIIEIADNSMIDL